MAHLQAFSTTSSVIKRFLRFKCVVNTLTDCTYKLTSPLNELDYHHRYDTFLIDSFSLTLSLTQSFRRLSLMSHLNVVAMQYYFFHFRSDTSFFSFFQFYPRRCLLIRTLDQTNADAEIDLRAVLNIFVWRCCCYCCCCSTVTEHIMSNVCLLRLTNA